MEKFSSQSVMGCASVQCRAGAGIVASLLLAVLAQCVRDEFFPTWSSAMQSIPHLSGQVIIVTGANSGLGLETAFQLGCKGATVIMACRSIERCETVRELRSMYASRASDRISRRPSVSLGIKLVADPSSWEP